MGNLNPLHLFFLYVQEKIIQQPDRWDSTNSAIVDAFDPPLARPNPDDAALIARFPHPQPKAFRLPPAAAEPCLTRANYKARMHGLLAVEELSQFDQLTRFNVVTKLHLTSR